MVLIRFQDAVCRARRDRVWDRLERTRVFLVAVTFDAALSRPHAHIADSISIAHKVCETGSAACNLDNGASGLIKRGMRGQPEGFSKHELAQPGLLSAHCRQARLLLHGSGPVNNTPTGTDQKGPGGSNGHSHPRRLPAKVEHGVCAVQEAQDTMRSTQLRQSRAALPCVSSAWMALYCCSDSRRLHRAKAPKSGPTT